VSHAGAAVALVPDAGLFASSHWRIRCASPMREYLPTESSSTITTRWPSMTACITRQRPAAEM